MDRLLLFVSLCFTLDGCAPPAYTPSDSGSGDPSIRITFPVSPDEEDTEEANIVYCSNFLVTVEVDNFTLSSEHMGGDPVEGEGHWHLVFTDKTLGNKYIATADEYAFLGGDNGNGGEYALAEGPNTIEAELAENNHQPLDPDVVWLTEITVDSTDPDCLGGGYYGGAGY